MPDLPLSAGVSTSLNLHTDQAARKEPVGKAAESFETVLRDKVKQTETQVPEATVATIATAPQASTSDSSEAKTLVDDNQASIEATDTTAALDPGLASLLLQLQSGTAGKVKSDDTDTKPIGSSTEISVATAGLLGQSIDKTPASVTTVQTIVKIATDEASASVAPDQAQLPVTPDQAQLPINDDQAVAASPALAALITNAAPLKGRELSQGQFANARPTDAATQVLAPVAISTQVAEQMALAGNAYQADSSGPGPSVTTLAMAKSAETLPTSTDQTNSGSGKNEFAHLLDRANTSLAAAQQQPATQSTQSTTTIALQQPAGQAAWQNELGDKMVWMANSQRQQADMVLNPPQLGRIEVSLTISGDQASAVFTSPNAAVREMLENSLPRLREVFAGAGIDLGEAQVNTGQSQQQHGSENRGDGGNGNNRSTRETLALESAGASVIAGATKAWSSSGKGLVDTFA
jgi:flagellar hook-length control protein FliK